MLKNTIFDTLPAKLGLLIAAICIALFVYVRYQINPTTDDPFWLDIKLYSFWGANIGMALTFWSSVYFLIVRMLESMEKKQKQKAKKSDISRAESSLNRD